MKSTVREGDFTQTKKSPLMRALQKFAIKPQYLRSAGSAQSERHAMQ